MVERSERKWVWYFALAVIIITTLPYVFAYQRQGADWRYTGFVFGVEDGNSYIAKMLAGANGALLFRTPYTPYAQQGSLIYLPFTLLGKLAAPPGQHEQLVAIFHLIRYLGIILFVFATYDFLALFTQSLRLRRLGTVLVSLGGGLGWLSVIGLSGLWGAELPLEFYSPESFGFLMLYGLPHLACARAFLLWGLRDYLLHMPPGSAAPAASGWRASLKTALIWFAAAVMQPLAVVAGWAAIGAHVAATALWQLWRQYQHQPAQWAEWRRILGRAVITGLLSLPMIAYTVLAFRLDPYLRSWESQNRLLSPPFLHYLLAYALILPLAGLGVRPLLRQNPWRGWLLAAWVIIFPLLAYFPYPVQRRLPEGVWVALVVLAVKGLEGLKPPAQKWLSRAVLAACIPALFLLLGGTLTVWQPRAPLFHPTAEVRAFEYLAEQAQPGALVLASFQTSNPLPAWAPLKTLIGHGPESMNGPALKQRIANFFQPDASDSQREQLLNEFGVTYVFYGPEERALGSWNPAQADYLRPVYTQAGYVIYQYSAVR